MTASAPSLNKAIYYVIIECDCEFFIAVKRKNALNSLTKIENFFLKKSKWKIT